MTSPSMGSDRLETLISDLIVTLNPWITELSARLAQSALETGDLHLLHRLCREQQRQAPDLVVQWIGGERAPDLLLYLDGIIDADRLTSSLVDSGKDATAALADSGLATQRVSSWSEVQNGYLSGQVVVVPHGGGESWLFDLSRLPQRSVGEPRTERTIRGSQEAFAEVVDVQLSQIRHRLPTPQLVAEPVVVGVRIPTSCRVVYLAGLASSQVVDTVRRRLANIQIDTAQSATRVGGLIRDHSWALFPTVRYTERVDLAAMQIQQGKVAVLVNGDPTVFTVPATLADYYRTSEDYVSVWYDASYVRLIRLLTFLFGVYLPAIYIALTEVNPDLISPTLLDLIVGTHSGLPFTPFPEVITMILVIEVLREAAARLPNMLGTTIGTMGAIVVGTAVVKAGFVSPQIIVLMTLTALSLFAVPSYELLASWRMMSWMMLILAFILGIYGIVLGTLAMSVALVSLHSFGTPYLTPLSPWRPKDWSNYLVRLPWQALKRRLTESKTDDLSWMMKTEPPQGAQ